MLRLFSSGVLVVALALMLTAGSAMASPSRRPQREAAAAPEPEPGQTRDDPYPSPLGLVLRGTNGYETVVGAIPAYRGTPSEALVQMSGARGVVKYIVPANLSGEGIHANFGRYGRVALRWVPDGGVGEVRARCEGFLVRHFFATGAYVGTVHLRGGNGFTDVTAHRIRWRRSWYSTHYGCLLHVSEGMPGPGTILEAGGIHDFWEPVHLDVIQNGPRQRVEYEARQHEKVGRMDITRYAFALGGPKTLTVGPGFRTGEISPPAPFSGTGRFERAALRGARGTWRGNLSVEFPDRTHLRLTGKAFEAVLHSGYHEQDFR